jgi:3-isopropylmalate dehydrogenase
MKEKKFTIAVLPGDGIGPEVIKQAIKVLKPIGAIYDIHFDLQYADIGAVAIDKRGEALPKATLQTCMNADAVLLGAIGDPRFDDPKLKVRPEQGLLSLRKSLGLFCNVRPVRAYENLLDLSPLKRQYVSGSDLVIYRELTGGIYFGEQGRKDNNTYAYDVCGYHIHEIERIVKLAFEAARLRKSKVTLVDKANVLESSRMWREVFEGLSKDYADVQTDYVLVDNAAMQLITNPAKFDVIVTSNIFGDIISDEASVICGSLGMLPSASIGDQYSLFEPVHGSYPAAAGKNIANPLATILSVALMLRHLDVEAGALQIEEAVAHCLEEGFLTEDLCIDKSKACTCSEVGDAVASAIRQPVV